MTVIICPNIGTETKMRIAKTEIKGIAIHSHLIPAMELGGIKVDEKRYYNVSVKIGGEWKKTHRYNSMEEAESTYREIEYAWKGNNMTSDGVCYDKSTKHA